MQCTRRQFLTASRIKDSGCAPRETRQHHNELTELPSDFSPALVRAQAKLLNLDVEHLSPQELEKAVLKALNHQRPPSTEKKAES